MDKAPWYYVDAERQRHGPVPAEVIRERLAAGELNLRSLAWRQGMPQWQAIEQLAGELGVALPATDPQATRVLRSDPSLESGATVVRPPAPPAPAPRQRDDALEQAYAAQVGIDPQAGHHLHLGGPVVYAGFLKRFAANFVDSFIVGMAGGLIGGVIGAIFGVAMMGTSGDPFAGSLVLQAINFLIGITIGVLYYGAFHSSSSQATPGKLLIGIKVARGDGERLTPLRAGARFLATYINLFTLGIGWLMAAFTDRKRALHDFICDTVVVDRWAYTEFPERQSEALGGCAIAILVLCGLFTLLVVAGVIAAIAAFSSSGGWN